MTKVYVGNLPAAVSEEELEKKFGSFGKIISIDIKVPPRPPAFAFLQFEVEAEAQAAVDALHDKEFGEEGSGKMKVEFSVSKGPRESGGERGDRRGRSDFRVIVSGMPRDISWQDLKDFCRQVGEVVYADVDRMGAGIAEFSRGDAMERCVHRLDDTEIRCRGRATGNYVRVRYERREAPRRDDRRDDRRGGGGRRDDYDDYDDRRGDDDRRGGGGGGRDRDDYDDRRGGGDDRGDERRRDVDDRDDIAARRD